MLKTIKGAFSELGRTKIRKATLESILSGILGQLLLIVSGIIVARSLGVEGRGEFALLTLFPHLIAQICSLGFPQAISHFIAKDNNVAIDVIENYLYIFFIQITAAIIIHVVILYFYSFDYIVGESYEYIMLAATGGIFIQQYAQAILQGLGKFFLFNISRLIHISLFSISAFMVFALEATSLSVMLVFWSCAQFVSGVLIYFLAKKYIYEDTSSDVVRLDRKATWSFGLKGMVGHSAPLENFRIDQLFIGFFLTPSMLGVYVVAQGFANLPRILARSIGMIAFPVISSSKDREYVRRITIRFLFTIVAACVPFVLLLTISMQFLVTYFYGVEFSGSIIIAKILIIGALFYSLRIVAVECLRGFSYPQISTYVELAMYPILFIFGILLIPKFGILGAALTVTVSYFLSCIIVFYLILKKNII